MTTPDTTASTQTAVITGAGSCIGRAIAATLAERSWRVIVTDIDAEAIDAVVFCGGTAWQSPGAPDIAGLARTAARKGVEASRRPDAAPSPSPDPERCSASAPTEAGRSAPFHGFRGRLLRQRDV